MTVVETALKKARKKKMAHSAQTYPTWESFVKAKVDQANEHLARMDQDKLNELLNRKK